jgi:hypothetical protein
MLSVFLLVMAENEPGDGCYGVPLQIPVVEGGQVSADEGITIQEYNTLDILRK